MKITDIISSSFLYEPIGTYKQNIIVTVEVSNTEEGFFHRIKVEDITSEWCGYTFISRIKFKDKIFCHATDYFLGVFPTEVPFEVVTGHHTKKESII